METDYAALSNRYIDEIWKQRNQHGLEGCLEEMERFITTHALENKTLTREQRQVAALAAYSRLLDYFPFCDTAKAYINKHKN
jgi:hypothetical protein